MEELINVFSSNQILILGIVLFIFGLILLGYLLTLIFVPKKEKGIKKEEINMIEKEEIKEEVNEIKNEEASEIIKEEVNEIKNEQIVEITKDVIEEESTISLADGEKINNDLEEMLSKMQKTLERKEEIDTVALYEKEQEENAIISYQELLMAAKKDFPHMNLIEDKKIKNTELENIIESISNDEEEVMPFEFNTQLDENKESKIIKVNSLDSKECQNLNEVSVEVSNIFESEKNNDVRLENVIKVQNDILDESKHKKSSILDIEEKQVNKDLLYKNNFKSSVFVSPIGVTGYNNINRYSEVKIRRDYLEELLESRFNSVDIKAEDLEYENKQNQRLIEELKSFRSNL